jgi:methyl-accepting chemotaxis protein/ligand-binding sensor domain-containing protein
MSVSRRFFAILFSGLFWAQVHSLPDARLAFNKLTVEDGLSQNFIRAILRDHRGFMWFGTENGLNRYDGYSFRVFHHDPKDSTSLAADRIACLYEDDRKRFWIGTIGGGLNLYDRERERFIRFVHDARNFGSLDTEEFRAVLQDRQGVLWVGTSMGLDRLDEAAGRLVRFTLPGDQSPRGMMVYAMDEGLDQSLWIGTIRGVFRIHPDRKRVDWFRSDGRNPNGLGMDEVRTLVVDGDGLVWMGTYGAGLNAFDPASGRWARYRYDPGNPEGIGHDILQCLALDGQGSLYIGMENGGLNVMDLKNRRFSRYLPDLADPASLSSNSVWSLFQDGRGVLWIGTFNGGVNLLSPYIERFKSIKAQPGGLNNPYILALCEDRRGDLWIGTDGGGLNRLDRRTGRYTYYRHRPGDPGTVGSDAVLSIFEDRRGEIWVGTWTGGVSRFDRNTGRFVTYRKKFQDWNLFGKQNNAMITEDGDGNVLVVTEQSLDVHDPVADRFVPFEIRHGIKGLVTNFILCYHEDRRGFVWMGGWRGLKRVDLKKKTFMDYRTDPANPQNLGNLNVLCLLEDSRGGIWVGTAGGLHRYLPDTDGFRCYTTEHGLPSNSIQSLVEDDRGNLWMGTAKGLVRWTGGIADPNKPRFRVFNVSDGLPGDEFKYGAYLKSRTGELFFGGQRGFVSFFPDRITDNPFQPPVVLTGFSIFNRPQAPGEKDSPLDSALSETKALTLAHDQDVLTFEFSALNYILPQKNQYAQKLEGFEKEWNQVGTRRTATYTNLNPGRYVLRVKASNNDGLWNHAGASLRIRVLPPFWETTWFRALAVLLLALSATALYRGRVRSLHAQREKLEREVADRTAELAQKKDEIEASFKRLAETGRVLAVHAVQMNAATGQIGEAMNSVRGGAEEQNELVRRTRLLIQSLLENIKMVTAETMIGSKAAQDAVGMVTSGTEAMETTLDNMAVIERAVRDIGAIVEGLRTSAGRVGGIVAFVEEIASQVNVLALNAQIEATRAGEYGRGFMVVAREIRNLARSTSQFTLEISEFIQKLQQDIRDIEKVTEGGITKVENSLGLTQKGKAALRKIRQSVEREKERLAEVVKHAKAMQAFSSDVENAVVGVEAVSGRNQATVEEVEANTREMQRQMEELTDLAQSLKPVS